jgi:hypothetical protein
MIAAKSLNREQMCERLGAPFANNRDPTDIMAAETKERRQPLLLNEEKPPEHGRNTDELRRCLRRQDALACAIGLMLLAVAAVATYLYWEYAQPFVASDDPFLAVRHFLIVVRAVATNLAWQRAAG